MSQLWWKGSWVYQLNVQWTFNNIWYDTLNKIPFGHCLSPAEEGTTVSGVWIGAHSLCNMWTMSSSCKGRARLSPNSASGDRNMKCHVSLDMIRGTQSTFLMRMLFNKLVQLLLFGYAVLLPLEGLEVRWERPNFLILHLRFPSHLSCHLLKLLNNVGSS